jgi:hypothetical protein
MIIAFESMYRDKVYPLQQLWRGFFYVDSGNEWSKKIL